MSFTAEVKEELSHVKPVCSHCQRATLAALVRIDGTLYLSGSHKYRLEITTDSIGIARVAKMALTDLYQLSTNLTIRRSVLHKTPNYLIEIPYQPGLEDTLCDLGVLSAEGGLEQGIRPKLIEKECCAAAYLRGAFLGSGFIANPQGDFHFEISLSSELVAQGVSEILNTKGIAAKMTHRRNNYVVYLKSGDAISDFLAFSGAHGCALSFERTRLYKSIANDVNRMTNAEMANLRKTANATAEFIETVRFLKESGNYQKLSPALREVVHMRLRYPDDSLKALGERFSPPLSKSAVAHRVRRIEDFAREIPR